MPFPNINPLIDTFFEPTRILLFGKKFPTLRYDPAPMRQPRGLVPGDSEFTPYTLPPDPQVVDGVVDPPPPTDLPMPPGRVEQALREVGDEGIFARIYGFSFEGHYYKMPRPLLFLVQGDGDGQPEEPVNAGFRQFNARFAGVAGKDWQFGDDIRVWAVDKHDIAVCLDLEIDTYDEVLLESLSGREESNFRGVVQARGVGYFRSAVFGPHQDR